MSSNTLLIPVLDVREWATRMDIHERAVQRMTSPVAAALRYPNGKLHRRFSDGIVHERNRTPKSKEQVV